MDDDQAKHFCWWCAQLVAQRWADIIIAVHGKVSIHAWHSATTAVRRKWVLDAARSIRADNIAAGRARYQARLQQGMVKRDSADPEGPDFRFD